MPSKLITQLAREVVPRPVRNWLRSPSQSAEWLWDSAQFSLGTTKSLAVDPGWSMICHPRAYKVAHRDQIQDEEQSAEFRNFISHCCPGMVLFDVGAHFGVFSLTAAHFGGTAVAVDPSPTATSMIRTQAALNHWEDKIQIVCAAVSDAEGEIELLNSGVFSNGYFKFAAGRSKKDLTRTPATTITQMARTYGNPTHIKIDVEGYEAAVLRGAGGALSQISPLLFLELHNEMIRNDGGNPSATLDLLDQFGYATFALSGEKISRLAILDKGIIRIVARRPGAAQML